MHFYFVLDVTIEIEWALLFCYGTISPYDK